MEDTEMEEPHIEEVYLEEDGMQEDGMQEDGMQEDGMQEDDMQENDVPKIAKISKMIEADDIGVGDRRPLTCGVEMEFLVPSIPNESSDPDRGLEERVIVSRANVPHLILNCDVRYQLLRDLKRQLCHLNFRHVVDDYFHPPYEEVVVYDAWRLGDDLSVTKRDVNGHSVYRDQYDWTACELTSPVMEATEFEAEIQAVCTVLNGIRIHLNKSTSVHVHIGLGNEPFTLRMVKMFATLYWFTEEAIMSLQHPSRWRNKHCFLLTRYSHLALKDIDWLDDITGPLDDEGLALMHEWVPNVDAYSTHAQLCRIWGARDFKTIATLMAGAQDQVSPRKVFAERGAVGFRRFYPVEDLGGNLQTFEFRQMAGSMDGEHICHWVKFCLEFTSFCRYAQEHEYKGFIEKILTKGRDFTGLDLLREFHVDTKIFETKMEKWAANPNFCDKNTGKELFVKN
ncbi:hypothetical protein GGR50DRAFT_247546 [Xylaria sp. CBS 124048]|nr:hypothetical protein GGR50DRAFT_247546 [Xylaria sp. CBS 124048]